METHLSLADLEKLTAVTFKTLKKRLANVSVVKKEGHINYYEAAEALPVVFQPQEKDELDLTKERAKLAAAQRKKIEVETEQLLGKLVDAAVWAEETAKLVTSFKDKLRSMALKIAPQVTQCDDQDINYELIMEAVDEALLELSELAGSEAEQYA